jgi:hypothetical protein
MGPSKPAAGERSHALCPLMRRDQGFRSEPRSSKRYEAFLRRVDRRRYALVSARELGLPAGSTVRILSR